MAPSRNTWDDESEDSTPPSSPPAPIARRSKFDDEEDSDEVLDSWDAAEDSEVEREKAAKAAAAKATAESEAKAAHRTKSQRIADNIQQHKQAAADTSSEEDEDESDRRARLRKNEQDSDLKHAEDLFGDIDLNRKGLAVKPVSIVASTTTNNTTAPSSTPADPTATIDLASLPLFQPKTPAQFTALRDALVPLLTANAKKPQYSLWLQEFSKQLARELPSDQIRKAASGLTTLANERQKEEKAAEKGGKKSKAAKTKATLVAQRDVTTRADTAVYDDGLDDGDFM